jgi:methylenetetrahydrofolate dehydrogenase (NADP+)/methenyltetrahydrofolate cyclohydrolase
MQTFLDGNIILGNEYAKAIRNDVKNQTQELAKNGVVPCLVVILVGENPASKIYVSNKNKFAIECGMKSVEVLLPSTITEKQLLEKINELNTDIAVHGILVQMPLPKHINSNAVINAIKPEKDVDGFHPKNMGALLTNTMHEYSLLPCTPLGCMHILQSLVPNLRGKSAVVIGMSNIVGKPLAAMLINKGVTVSVLNSATQNRTLYTKNADILITACGVPNLVSAEDITNPVILDVGINRLENGKIVGDCDFEKCKSKAKFITPVPGGIGPMTIAMLLQNTVLATKWQMMLKAD